MSRIRTERGLDRLVNFSDATVAIAITLLVLPLVDDAGRIGTRSFWAFVADHANEFVALLVSFVVIARFWISHHRLFELMTDYSTALIRLNFLWLVGIVLLPFVTNAVSNVPDGNGSVYAAYIGTMLLTSLALLLMEIELRRHPELLGEAGRGRVDLIGSLALITLMVVAAVLAYALPRVGMFWLLLLLAAGPLKAGLRRTVPGLGPAAAPRR